MTKTFMLGALALATVGFAAQEGLVLRRTYKENTSETYELTTEMKQTADIPGMGEQDLSVKSTSTYTFKVGKVDAQGNADITTELKVDKVDADGMLAQMVQDKPKPVVAEGKMDAKGHFTPAKEKALDVASMMMGASQSIGNSVQVEFPDKAVKIGDTWDIVVPKSPVTGDKEQKLTAKLVGDKKVGDTDVWIVSVTGKIETNVDTSKLPKNPDAASNPMANMTMTVKGTVDITSETLVDKATGKTVQSEQTSKVKQTVEVAEQGMTIPVNGTSKTTAKLKA